MLRTFPFETLTAAPEHEEICRQYNMSKKIIATEEAKKKVWHKELMNTYFTKTEILVSSTQIILATAKCHEVETFDKDAFKADHPELYAKYLVQETRQPLQVK